MDSRINREQILDEFLKNIACLSDKPYQERVWVAAEGPECDDIEGAVCDFFDDGDPILENYKDFGITDAQYDLLLKLHKKLRTFTDENDIYYPDKSTARVIKMPEWEEIRTLANEVLVAFDYRKDS